MIRQGLYRVFVAARASLYLRGPIPTDQAQFRWSRQAKNSFFSASLTLILVGCGASQPEGPYYETQAFQVDPVSSKDRKKLVQAATKILKSRPLVVGLDGRQKIIRQAHIARLPLVVLKAYVLAGKIHKPGAEIDILIPVSHGKKVPVTLITKTDGSVTILAATKTRSRARQAAYIPRFRNGDAQWSSAHRKTLRLAMSLLPKTDAAFLSDIPLSRYKTARDKRKGAVYLQKGCTAEIRVYNRAFDMDKLQFVGAPNRPYPASMRTVLHEVGHAIHSQPSRMAACQLQTQEQKLNTRIKRYNRRLAVARQRNDRRLAEQLETESRAIGRARKKLKSLAKAVESLMDRGPVLKAYQAATGSSPAPTVYGRSSLKESFAEAFALFRSDRAALKRAMPKAYEWFARGGHLKAADRQ